MTLTVNELSEARRDRSTPGLRAPERLTFPRSGPVHKKFHDPAARVKSSRVRFHLIFQSASTFHLEHGHFKGASGVGDGTR